MNRSPLARSLLFVPGNQPQRVEKALASCADAVIIDLEDAVPAADKRRARETAGAALGRREAVFVRINGFDDPACFDDLEAIVRPGLAGVVVPKVEAAQPLATLDWLVTQLERRAGMKAGAVELLPLVETARGVEALPQVAAASGRIRRLSFGVADYSLDLGVDVGPGEDALSYIRSRLVHCSRAVGLEQPVDSVVVDIRDADRFRESAWRARRLGLFGKLCIHPDQVSLAHEVFAPTAAELARSRAIVDAWETAGGRGEAAITVNGEFVDGPIAARARRILSFGGG